MSDTVASVVLIIAAMLMVLVVGYNLCRWFDRDIDAALADEEQRLAKSLEYLSQSEDRTSPEGADDHNPALV
jgi:hypothetical protein